MPSLFENVVCPANPGSSPSTTMTETETVNGLKTPLFSTAPTCAFKENLPPQPEPLISRDGSIFLPPGLCEDLKAPSLHRSECRASTLKGLADLVTNVSSTAAKRNREIRLLDLLSRNLEDLTTSLRDADRVREMISLQLRELFETETL